MDSAGWESAGSWGYNGHMCIIIGDEPADQGVDADQIGMTVKFDSRSLPSWAKWIAQDASGVWWAYSVEPLRYDHGWYENEVGDCLRLGCSDATGWQASLCRVGMAEQEREADDETR